MNLIEKNSPLLLFSRDWLQLCSPNGCIFTAVIIVTPNNKNAIREIALISSVANAQCGI